MVLVPICTSATFALRKLRIRVAWCAGRGSPDQETVGCLEVAHTGGVQHARAAAGGCDHQDLGLVGVQEPTVGHPVHPDADPVSDAQKSVLESRHRGRILSI